MLTSRYKYKNGIDEVEFFENVRGEDWKPAFKFFLKSDYRTGSNLGCFMEEDLIQLK